MHYIVMSITLGIAGSLHCIGMCGPLVSALHTGQRSGPAQKIYYHLGRSLGYGLLGALAGTLGHTLQWATTQQWLALVAGSLFLITLLAPRFMRLPPTRITTFVRQWRQKAMGWWQTGRPIAAFTLGTLNAWLPCGLVYSALAAAALTASGYAGALFMMCFGIANTPALWASASLLQWAQGRVPFLQPKRVQTLLTLFALLVMLRGAGLGIPYISPVIAAAGPTCCHP